MPIKLRRVQQTDCELLWQWANDPTTRIASFSPHPIPWAHHVEWFQAKMIDPDCVFFIATTMRDVPVGQIRYDIQNDSATVSVSIDKSFRGQGYGTLLIEQSCRKLLEQIEVAIVNAYIKIENTPSKQTFLNAGFIEQGATMVHNHSSFHLIWRQTKDSS